MLLFRHRLARAGGLAAAAAATAAAGVTAASAAAPPPGKGTPSALPAAVLVYEPKSEETVENWSATHSASPVAYFSPETAAGVQHILALMHEAGQRLRVVGSALSPNGIGLSDENMLNMVQLDKVVSIDKEKKQVTVQAGARVADVVEALRPSGLTLQNYASIAEQQIGGFLQVSAQAAQRRSGPASQMTLARSDPTASASYRWARTARELAYLQWTSKSSA